MAKACQGEQGGEASFSLWEAETCIKAADLLLWPHIKQAKQTGVLLPVPLRIVVSNGVSCSGRELPSAGSPLHWDSVDWIKPCVGAVKVNIHDKLSAAVRRCVCYWSGMK